MSTKFKSGSLVEFDRNWRRRNETQYNHWCGGAARNQIQLAFASHFQVFGSYLRRDGGRKGMCLEVGAGRGSISSFFADAKYSCTLLDTSVTALEAAKHIFSLNGHRAEYVVGDANRLAFPADNFDVVVSIGLLEHFEDIETPLREQLRVLRPGGRCFCYVVPQNRNNVQKYFRFVNTALHVLSRTRNVTGASADKEPVYRTASLSRDYIETLARVGAVEIEATGMYPMPMISSSPDFPFTLMHPAPELGLTYLYRGVLWLRSLVMSDHPWTCAEKRGQAFLVTCRKS